MTASETEICPFIHQTDRKTVVQSHCQLTVPWNQELTDSSNHFTLQKCKMQKCITFILVCQTMGTCKSPLKVLAFWALFNLNIWQIRSKLNTEAGLKNIPLEQKTTIKCQSFSFLMHLGALVTVVNLID